MVDISHNFTKLERFIRDSNNVLIATHEKPDGDALGSMLALAHHLDDLGKDHSCFSKDNVIDKYYYLPGIEKVTDERNFDILDFDLIIFVDSGDLKRTGLNDHMRKIDKTRAKVVNIDHHLTVFEEHGHLVRLNIVNLDASSVAEIIFQYFTHSNIEIDKDKATNLLTGIITDTGCFSNLATTVFSFSVAAQLLNRGVNIKRICDNVLKNKNISSLKLWGRALSRLVKNEETGIVTSALTQKDIKECDAEGESTEGISNFLNTLSGAKFTLLFKEEKGGKIKGSLRTTQDDVDVSKIAADFGGGGHKRAAGFTVWGRLKKTDKGWEVEELKPQLN